MTRALTIRALSVALLAVAGCQSAPPAASPAAVAPAAQKGITATFTLDPAHSSLYQRGVLYLAPTRSVQVTVQAPDLTTPFTVTKTLDSLDNGVSMTVDSVPEGTLRVVTLQWLDGAGKPIDGLYYRAQGTLDDQHQHLLFNDQTTAEGSVLLSAMKLNHDKAAILKSADISNWMQGVLDTAHVSSSRFLDVDAVAQAMIGLSTKNMPTPKPEWGLPPGYVSVGFTDIQDGLLLKAGVNDPVSGAATTDDGETLLLGPIPARDTTYKLSVQVVPTNGEGIGPDLALAPTDVTVKADTPAVVPNISFCKSVPGAPMSERAGRGTPVLVSGGSEDELWVVNGVKRPDGDFKDLPLNTGTDPDAYGPQTPSVPAQAAYRYRDSARKWDTALVGLPASFPLFGMAAASVQSQIYVFGGFVNQARSAFVGKIETSGTPGFSASSFTMPPDAQSADNSPMRLTNAVATAIGGKIYIAGGTAHDDQSTGDNTQGAPPTFLEKTLVFDPATGFGPALPGPGNPHQDMAAAAVGSKWYLFGGYETVKASNGTVREPSADVQVFNLSAQTWTNVKPMPTPRYGCATVVAGNKIWVIGGETLRGKPSRAVEVYDPDADSWTRRAPLRTPRSYAAAFSANRSDGTKIVVAGGVEGLSGQGFPMPVDKTLTEELTP